MMLPEEVFKRRRRHNNTPEPMLLIITNFIVVSLALTVFTDKKHINSFFWVSLGLLALYNFFNIRKNREVFDKVTVIAYVIALFTLVAMFFLFKGKA